MSRSLGQNDIINEYDDSGGLTRDRIVLLGRRSAGKTVYLSLLYNLLWKSNNELSMKTVEGTHHALLIKTAEELRRGQWPAATQNMSQIPIEINYGGKTRLMIALDYPGELFTNAFVKELSSDEIHTLLDHIDHAQALMLLVDPEHVAGEDIDATIDNDYGIVQALNRLQNWAGGTKIPVVLIFTKIDQTNVVIKKHGGTEAFVRKYFPKLISQLNHLIVCKVAAVKVAQNADGRLIPKENFESFNLDKPLRHCLEVIENIEGKKAEDKAYKKRVQFLDELEAKKKKNSALLTIFLLFVLVIFIIMISDQKNRI